MLRGVGGFIEAVSLRWALSLGIVPVLLELKRGLSDRLIVSLSIVRLVGLKRVVSQRAALSLLIGGFVNFGEALSDRPGVSLRIGKLFDPKRAVSDRLAVSLSVSGSRRKFKEALSSGVAVPLLLCYSHARFVWRVLCHYREIRQSVSPKSKVSIKARLMMTWTGSRDALGAV